MVPLAAALGLLVACGTAPAAPPTEPGGKATETSEPTAEPPIATERVEVIWSLGRGSGINISDYPALQTIIDEYNASQDRIELVIGYEPMEVDLSPYIYGNNAVDILGPMGTNSRNWFKGAWMDLQPLIDASGYDLSDFDPAMVQFYQDKEEGRLGIPFAVFPSFIFVNKDLFDNAGLPYPPQEYGAPYVDENGEAHPWNLDTLRELAMKLTVDKNGNNAASPYFDAESIIQFGYLEQYADMRGVLTLFGPGSLVAGNGKTAQIPDHWREGTHWVYDAMWKDHFWPTDTYITSDTLGNSASFQSGNLAMAHIHSWFAAPWALDPNIIDFTWDAAAVPAYSAHTTARLYEETFYIPKSSKNPEEAFEVLTYLLSPEIALKLVEMSGGVPARSSLQSEHMAAYSEKVFPGQTINWQVVIDSISYADIPNHESWLPNSQQSIEAYTKSWTRLGQDPSLDVDAELDALREKLQAIFDEAEE